MQANCPLCADTGGELVFQHALYRVIVADEALYPGFLRLVWNSHVREFSDLSSDERHLCMDVVCTLERFVLERFNADKANLATLGNMVAHLHWHVIPRFKDDTHFPAPVWGSPSRHQRLCERQVAIKESQASWVPELQKILASLS